MAAFGAWAQPVAASISAAATVSAAEIGAASNDRTNETNLKNWREQRQWDLEQWERENQYNDPSQQAQRLMDAGINPLTLAGDAGNATSFAGGQTPPQLIPTFGPSEQQNFSKAFDLQSYAKAFKDYQEAKGQQNANIVSGFEVDAYRESALKGENPELYKIGVMLESYNKIKKENKWIDPVTEASLKKVGVETDMTKKFLEVRQEEVNKIREEVKGIKLTNDFNAQAFPSQLRLLSEQILSEVQRRANETAATQAQVNAANESANAAHAQAGLTAQLQDTELQKTIEMEFKNGLRKLGINPDSKNLPFFVQAAYGLTTKQITDQQLADFFENLQYAERVGWRQLAKSKCNLTKFELFGTQDKNPLNQLPLMLQLFQQK